jgi:IS30 family transposase
MGQDRARLRRHGGLKADVARRWFQGLFGLDPCASNDRLDYRLGVGALAKHVRRLPAVLRRSLTWDRGKEMAGHKAFTIATDVKVYFCDPRSPWQRGSNENTNGLLRQYFPKGKDLSVYSQAYLNKIAQRLNQRPRLTLGFECPEDRLRAVLQ